MFQQEKKVITKEMCFPWGKRGIHGILLPHHVYINMCATFASTPYPHLLTNLKKEERALMGHSNMGSGGMEMSGEMGAVNQMWLNEGGVATIIPLKVLEKIWPVTYDSRRNGGCFIIHTDQGNIIVKNNSKGMPYLDIRDMEAEVVLSFIQTTIGAVKAAMVAPANAVSFIQTVRGNMEGYMQHEVEDARAARKAQAMLGHPTDRNFLGMVRSGMILNCPVTPNAVQNAHRIFSPDLAGVRGRTVRRPPDSVTTNYIQIPRALLEWHQRVTMAVNVMFVNGVPFLVSMARGLTLVTAEHMPTRTAKQLAAGIIHVMDLYSRGGFQVGTVLMDNEFEKLQNLVPVLAVNTTVAKEHVPKVERCIRLIKECSRGVLNTLLFKKMPQIMLIDLFYHILLWLNAFPTKSGVSETLSPREIVMRHKLDFAKHCRALFGSYCKTHDEPVPMNTMVTRSTPAIVLGPTGNLQGTYKFFRLETGKKIKRHKFTACPMPDLVIKKVEAFGKSSLGVFDFADRNGILFKWNKEVDKCPEGIIEEDVVLYPFLIAKFPGVTLGQDHPIPTIKEDIIPQGRAKADAARNANMEQFAITGVDAPTIIHANINEIDETDDDNNGIISVANIPAQANQDPLIVPDTSDKDDGDDDNNNEEDNDDNDNNTPQEYDPENELEGESEGDEAPGVEDKAPGVRRSKRKNKGVTNRFDNNGLMMNAQMRARGSQGHATIHDRLMFFSADDLSNAKPVPEEDREEYALGIVLVHYSMGAGIKKFKERGEAGVTKELTQMHDMDVFRPVARELLTKKERTKAISSLMFLKEKRDQSVKARMCADGRKQRGDWTKQETTSPTISTEAVFITAVIDAHEERDVACFDIPDAFLHADSD